MHLVYVDEAGISNPQQEPFLVVAAVIIHADHKLQQVERYLDTLVERHIPTEHQKGFIFHAMELFNGGGKVFKRHDPQWPLEKRLKIADDLAAIPKKFRLPLAFGFVERATFPHASELLKKAMNASDLTVAAHVTAFMTCAMQVEHWMRIKARDEVCLMVVEDNDRARKLIRDTQNYHQNRDLALLLPEEARKHFPFRKIKEDPLFQMKRPSSALQVADFCAYVFKKFLIPDRRYDRFVQPFWGQLAAASMEHLSAQGTQPS